MQLFIRLSIYFWAFSCLWMTAAQAEPYHLIAGSSQVGYRENYKENVSLGFSEVFNEVLAAENIRCDITSFDSSEALYAAIHANQVNAFFGSPIEYLNIEQYFLKQPLAAGLFGGKTTSKIYLLVRADSQINSIKQLKGKKLVTLKSNTGDISSLFLETLLLENKLPPPKSMFSEIVLEKTSNSALIELFFKKADAALISETQFNIAAELNPQLRANIKLLEASESYLAFVSALGKDTPAQEVKVLENSLMNVNKTTKGKSVMRLLNIDAFREISTSDFDNVRALILKNKRLRAEQNVH